MLRVVNYIAAVVLVILSLAPLEQVSAELTPVPTSPVSPSSALMITAYQAASDGLNLVQLYNGSDDLLTLDGMQLRYSRKSNPAITESIPLSGRMLPNSHILAAAVDVLTSNNRVSFRFAPSGWEPKTLWIESPNFLTVTIPTDLKTDDVVYKRSRTTTGYSTAVSALNTPLSTGSIEADHLYDVPPEPLVEIVEVLARSKSCSPFEASPTCSDYIKLRMKAGFDASDIGRYRVRTGTSESVTNTFSLLNATVHDNYLLLNLRDDGDVLSLTNSGGYVWLEDIFGVTRYGNTLISYADAGSEKYVDQSWALNDQTGIWTWAIPSPIDANNFPIITNEPEIVSTPAVCPAGKYRNPETNRCRSIEDAVSELAACEEGKERNPATNRCRSIITTAAATLVSSEPGEERNILTNRCRRIAAASQALAACGENQERNPETNRCRKVSSASPNTLAAVTDVQSPIKESSKKWIIAAVVLVAVIGYAVYEWRQDITLFTRSLLSRIGARR